MHINASKTLLTREITILHINIKTTLNLKSEDSKTRVDMKCHFQALIKNSILFICPENSNIQSLRLTQDPFISENFRKTEKFKFEKVQLSQRHLVNKFFFLNYFFHFGNEKSSTPRREKVHS